MTRVLLGVLLAGSLVGCVSEDFPLEESFRPLPPETLKKRAEAKKAVVTAAKVPKLVQTVCFDCHETDFKPPKGIKKLVAAEAYVAKHAKEQEFNVTAKQQKAVGEYIARFNGGGVDKAVVTPSTAGETVP